MLKFTRDCAKNGIAVRMSVVSVIGAEKVEQARKIAEKLGVDFICREFDE